MPDPTTKAKHEDDEFSHNIHAEILNMYNKKATAHAKKHLYQIESLNVSLMNPCHFGVSEETSL